MGRLEVNNQISIEAEDDYLDSLEDIEAVLGADIDREIQLTSSPPQRSKPSFKNARRRLEDKLEEIRLQRQLDDYGQLLN